MERVISGENEKRTFDFQLVMKFVITLVITKIKAAFYSKTALFGKTLY